MYQVKKYTFVPVIRGYIVFFQNLYQDFYYIAPSNSLKLSKID